MLGDYFILVKKGIPAKDEAYRKSVTVTYSRRIFHT